MNRKQRQEFYREHHAFVRTLPDTLTVVPEYEYPPMNPKPIRAWRSKKYVVQEWRESNPDYPNLIRLSVCRSTIKSDGTWQEDITWEELQSLKREIGYGDWYAIEIYPRDCDVVNVANFRHLWLLREPLSIGWTEDNH